MRSEGRAMNATATERPTPPSTLDGVKRLAKRIKKAEGIQHAHALDKAAQQAGYRNFAHARRQLALRAIPKPFQPPICDED
jgi:hypothetical protein